MVIIMKNAIELPILHDRLAKIAEERASLDREEQEINEAIKIISRYASGGVVAEEASSITPQRDNKLGPARPKGIPTLYQMAYEVIRDAEQRGKPGLTGAAIVEAIGEQYWPGVTGPQILPSIYGFAKSGRLRKSDNGLFQTVRKNEAPTDNSEGASEPENGGTTNPDMFSKP